MRILSFLITAYGVQNVTTSRGWVISVKITWIKEFKEKEQFPTKKINVVFH